MKKDMTEKTNVATLFRLLKWLYNEIHNYKDGSWEDLPNHSEKTEIENLMKDEEDIPKKT